MNAIKFTLSILIVYAGALPQAMGTPVMGSELASFAVLGASTVTNTGATTLIGNLGVDPGSAITGKASITVNGTNAASQGNTSVHEADAYASLAQSQFSGALASLGLLGSGTLEPFDLAGLTLVPGVYSVPAGTSNLTGTLTLDGKGDANAFWVFQMPSTLITSPGSVVNVINTGAGAGVYWNVGSSATLDTGTLFEGNILALASITLNHGAVIECGRALAHVGAVTMDNNTVSTGCAGTGEEGSNGLSGGLAVPPGGGVPVPLPFTPVPGVPGVPEPGTFLLMGLALAGLLACSKKTSA